MAISWRCDICDKETQVNPKMEPQFEEKEVSVDVPQYVDDPNKPGSLIMKMVKQTQKFKVPKMKKMTRKNPITGAQEEIDVQEIVDLEARAHIVTMQIGMTESLKRDFCEDCLKKEILPILKPIWDKLESIESK